MIEIKINSLIHKHKADKSPYDVVLDELLVAQEDLLPAEDGGFRPGLESSGAGLCSCQHLRLCRFGNSAHHLVSGLRRKGDGADSAGAGSVTDWCSH